MEEGERIDSIAVGHHPAAPPDEHRFIFVGTFIPQCVFPNYSAEKFPVFGIRMVASCYPVVTLRELTK